MSKKMKKMKKNKKKNNKNKKVILDESAEALIEKTKHSNKYKNSLVYLDNFIGNKDIWKFNKNTQYILLKSILNKELYDQKYFKMFRKYMKTMGETTRKSFVEKCLKDIENFKDNKLVILEGKKFNEEETENTLKAIWNKRALKIVEKFL